MTFDVIIVANSKTDELIKTTQNAIDSLHKSESEIRFCVMVVETSGKTVNYKDAFVVKYPFINFNYNRALNFGINLTGNQYILCCNNDLIFKEGFATKLLEQFEAGYKSLSPYCFWHHSNLFASGDYAREGYRIGHELVGWCIAVERSLIRFLGGFNEVCSFWFSDHVYAEQLKAKKIKHGLVGNSFVDHLGSQTLNGIDLSADEYYDITFNQKQYFDNYTGEIS